MGCFLLLLVLASGACAELLEVVELRDDIRLLKNEVLRQKHDFKQLKDEMAPMKLQHQTEIERLQRQLPGLCTFQIIWVTIFIIINGIRNYIIFFVLTVEQDSTSFFSVQLAEDTIVAHNGTVNFYRVIVNFGADYIQSGGIYM